MVCSDMCCGNAQELVPLKQEGTDADFRLSCSLPVGDLSWLCIRPRKLSNVSIYASHFRGFGVLFTQQ